MCGAVPPILCYIFMAWCLVKHRDNFTFIVTVFRFRFVLAAFILQAKQDVTFL